MECEIYSKLPIYRAVHNHGTLTRSKASVRLRMVSACLCGVALTMPKAQSSFIRDIQSFAIRLDIAIIVRIGGLPIDLGKSEESLT